MHYFIESFGLLPGGLFSALIIFLRYALFAGAAFFVCYRLKRHVLGGRKIQRHFPAGSLIWSEIGHSAGTALVFAAIGVGLYFLRQQGYTRIYLDPAAYGWGYLVCSFGLLVLIHDTYFYWLHRLMHYPRLFRLVHRVHHQSFNPTPWASFSFHPLEAILEVAIVPLLVLILPFHPLVLLLFTSWSLAWNVVGHLGYEFFPAAWVDHPVWRWFNTSTHHNLHHHRGTGNYGLYFNFWDTWMGTNHPEYRSRFLGVTETGGVDKADRCG